MGWEANGGIFLATHFKCNSGPETGRCRLESDPQIVLCIFDPQVSGFSTVWARVQNHQFMSQQYTYFLLGLVTPQTFSYGSAERLKLETTQIW